MKRILHHLTCWLETKYITDIYTKSILKMNNLMSCATTRMPRFETVASFVIRLEPLDCLQHMDSV